MSNEPAILVEKLKKGFHLPGGGRLEILKGVDFEAQAGESVAIMGSSGSGKTTLLHIIAGIDGADAGAIFVAGDRPGLVFQAHYLMPELDAEENVALGARLAGAGSGEAAKRARACLDAVGLAARRSHFPNELSGGETARVAIARALAAEPDVLLADEPTGNLDEETSAAVQDLLFRLVRERRRTLVIVTHDREVAARADRTLRLEHGLLR